MNDGSIYFLGVCKIEKRQGDDKCLRQSLSLSYDPHQGGVAPSLGDPLVRARAGRFMNLHLELFYK